MKIFLFFISIFSISNHVFAQLNCTPHDHSNGQSLVTFNVENTNTFPINIHTIRTSMFGGASGTYDFKILYRTTPVASTGGVWTGGPIGPGVGSWIDGGSATITIPTHTAPVPVLTGLTLEIPAGATYGFALTTTSGTIGYQTLTVGAGVVSSSSGGVNLLTGDNIGWGGTSAFTGSATPTFYPRGWAGCIEWSSLEPCSGVPAGGTASAAPTSGAPSSTFLLSISDGELASALEYQWQISTDGVTWSDIPGATTAFYTATAIPSIGIRFYRLKTTCTISGEISYSSVTTYETLAIVCSGLGMSTTASHNVIFHVENTNPYSISINSISTRLTAWGGAGYRDFKLMYNPTALYASGGLYPVPVGSGVGGWVDAGPPASIYIPAAPSMDPVEVLSGFDIIIPPGETYTLCLATYLNSLAVYSMFGITEEEADGVKIITGTNISWVGFDDIFYTSGTPSFATWGFIGCIGFEQVAPCTDPSIIFPTFATPTASPLIVCGTGTTILDISSYYPLATGMTFQWEQAPTAAGPWTDASTDLYIPNYAALISSDTYFRCKIKCEGTVILTSDVIFVESLNPELPTVSDAQTCGPGEVTFTASVSTGDIFWYDMPAGGTLLGSGATYTTPLLTTTTTYYVSSGIAGCESPRVPVTAHVRDVPDINIAEDDGTYCLFNNEFTINSYPEVPLGSSIIWSTGATSPSITVGISAPNTKYWIEITNEFGCKDSDTITLSLNPSPVVDLGPDKHICEGGSIELDAGPDGSSYFWNTGASTRTITVDVEGQYEVLVTNSYGCMATDTIYVEVEGFAPEIAGIIVNHLGGNTFQYSAHLPNYIDNYEWNFGDGTPVSYSHSPIHTYSAPGTYLVTCKVASSCATRDYTTYNNIFTGINSVDIEKFLNIYPNPTNDYIHVVTDLVDLKSIRITNIVGQVVLNATEINNPKAVKIDVSNLPSGTYHMNIETDQGNVIKTFQIVK